MLHPNNLHTFDDLMPEEVCEGMHTRSKERTVADCHVPPPPSAFLTWLADQPDSVQKLACEFPHSVLELDGRRVFLLAYRDDDSLVVSPLDPRTGEREAWDQQEVLPADQARVRPVPLCPPKPPQWVGWSRKRGSREAWKLVPGLAADLLRDAYKLMTEMDLQSGGPEPLEYCLMPEGRKPEQ